jgi:ribosomal protein L37AE/L43A
MMPVAIMFFLSIVLAGSALTFAKRKREPCTACRKGELVHGRDYAWHCRSCKARFVREGGQLVQRDA